MQTPKVTKEEFLEAIREGVRLGIGDLWCAANWHWLDLGPVIEDGIAKGIAELAKTKAKVASEGE